MTSPPGAPDDLVGDVIGRWSEIKLEIIRKYAAAYSTILSSQRSPRFAHSYIDGFAGAGHHRSRASGLLVPGSARIALDVEPPFREYHFVELQARRVEALRELSRERELGREREQVYLYQGDANEVLLHQVFPRIRYEDYRRALCLLDPYGMQLDWRVLEAAGKSRTIDVFVNFPIMAINRNVLRRDAKADPAQAASLTRVWGDESWRQIAYGPPAQRDLFDLEQVEKRDNDVVAQALRHRLQEVAGFQHVAEPLPMMNVNRATVYYLYFASQRPVARDIVDQIFDTYRE